MTSNDSLFGRVSWQRRDPDAFTFESTGGNGGSGLTNLGILDRASRATTIATGWTRIFSNSIVNELRGGYSEDVRDRRSQYIAGEVGASVGIEVPALAQGVPGFPQFIFAGANRPSDIRDQRQNTFRDLDQASFSISNNTTWVKGRHSVRFGGNYARNFATDGYSTGANESKGQYNFSGWATGNAFADFLLGLPNTVREQRNTRGDQPMDTVSNDWALFVQDDFKLSSQLTLFLGLRYEVVGVFVDKSDIFANFVLDDGGHHVVPNAQIAQLLPPGAIALNRTILADSVGVGDWPDEHRSEQLQPACRASPTASAATRRRSCAAVSASSTRPVPRRARATSCRATPSATASRAIAPRSSTASRPAP